MARVLCAALLAVPMSVVAAETGPLRIVVEADGSKVLYAGDTPGKRLAREDLINVNGAWGVWMTDPFARGRAAGGLQRGRYPVFFCARKRDHALIDWGDDLVTTDTLHARGVH